MLSANRKDLGRPAKCIYEFIEKKKPIVLSTARCARIVDHRLIAPSKAIRPCSRDGCCLPLLSIVDILENCHEEQAFGALEYGLDARLDRLRGQHCPLRREADECAARMPAHCRLVARRQGRSNAGVRIRWLGIPRRTGAVDEGPAPLDRQGLRRWRRHRCSTPAV